MLIRDASGDGWEDFAGGIASEGRLVYHRSATVSTAAAPAGDGRGEDGKGAADTARD